MTIKEDLLQYLWRTKRFDLHDLQTTEGDAIEIQDFGTPNHHAGPDFLNAKIKINNTLWAGNVEMHVRASDWLLHGHTQDLAYDNVILHVVFEEDKPIYQMGSERMPCLELRSRIPLKIANTYQKLLHNEYWIPCQAHFSEVAEMTKAFWLDRLLVERLEHKTKAIEIAWRYNNNDWEETFYQFLASNFGVKVNAEPFECLARSLPQRILSKHKDSLFQIEALLFGQAGMLNYAFEDDYPEQLKKEYQFLKAKYQLQPIEVISWKFMRLRPANFPTIRLAQLAQLVHQSSHLFSRILEIETIVEIEALFKVQPSAYWENHYLFDKPSEKRSKAMGKKTINLLIINTLSPFLFLYGTKRGIQSYRDRAIKWLETIPAEENNIIENWQQLGMQPKSAYETQALIQLKNEYCNTKNCLNCAIGNAILK
jgi:hypothetical protein